MKLEFIFTFVVLTLTATGGIVAGQEQGGIPEPFPPAIEDNSFFIEEAYNQEAGVVQHISTFFHLHAPAGGSAYSFTQEWPLASQAHQLSYSIPYNWQASAAGSGFGDASINYRYQWFGRDDWAAVAPRVSLILPTSNAAGGDRAPGLQVNLPVSKRVSGRLVLHANAGATFVPGSKGRGRAGDEVERGLWTYNLGASAVGLLTPRLNVLLELSATSGQERDGAAVALRYVETIVSPGVRYAINLGSLQVVPGLAVPVRISSGQGRVGTFLYLSLEHPFR